MNQPAPTTPTSSTPTPASMENAWASLRTNVAIAGALGSLPYDQQKGIWIDFALRLAQEVTGKTDQEVLPLGGATQGLAKVRSWMGFRILERSTGGTPGKELLVVRFAKAKDNLKEIVPAPFAGEGSGADGDEITKRFIDQYRAACGVSPLQRLRPHVVVIFNEVTRPLHPYVPVAKDRLQKYWPQIGTGIAGLAVAWWMIGGIVSCAHGASESRARDEAQKAAHAQELEKKAGLRKESGKEITQSEVAFAFRSLKDDELLSHLFTLLTRKDAPALSGQDVVRALSLLPRESGVVVSAENSFFKQEIPATVEVAFRLILKTTAPITADEATALFRSSEEVLNSANSDFVLENKPALRKRFAETISSKLQTPVPPVEKKEAEPVKSPPPDKSKDGPTPPAGAKGGKQK